MLGQYWDSTTFHRFAFGQGKVTHSSNNQPGKHRNRVFAKPNTGAASRQAFRRTLCVKGDLYSILQVPETATRAEIKAAYRRLARELHPDVSHNPDTDRFQAVSDAYSILSNDSLRRKYNELGSAGLGPQYTKYAATGSRRAARRAPEPGKDVMTVMWLDMVDAALGIERTVEVKVATVCPSCSGLSSQAAVTSSCHLCRGSGEIMRQQTHKHGKLGYLGACPKCGGKGSRVQQWCHACGGRGLARIKISLAVRVPPGVDNDSVLRLRGKGDEGRFGGQPGDVYVSFVIRPRPDISRRGLDLHSKVTVAYTDAILGSCYEVQTIRGTALLSIPAGTQHGEVLTLTGQGIDSLPGSPASSKAKQLPGSASKTGSHKFHVIVRLPIEVTSREADILEQLIHLQRR